MGEIMEGIANSLIASIQKCENTSLAVIRTLEAGDFAGTPALVVAQLWEDAYIAQETYDQKVRMIRQSFPDQAEAIIDRAWELR